MADILATLFRFRQFVFEFGPFFLAVWLGLAVTTGLLSAASKREASSGSNRFGWLLRLPLFLLWHPGGKTPAALAFSGRRLFGSAAVPALVVTSLTGTEIVGMRLILMALFALALGWFVPRVISRWPRKLQEQLPETEETVANPWVSAGKNLRSPAGRRYAIIRIVWRSFTVQVEGAVIPLIIGLSLASALTIYVPAHVVRPWLGVDAWQGPYLAALLAMPFQLAGGAEVLLASSLLIKGASLGTVLSVMLAAPAATFTLVRYLHQSTSAKAVALYLVATWLVAGSLGVVVDGVQQLLSGWG